MKDLIKQAVAKTAKDLYNFTGDIEIKPIPFKGEWGFSTTVAFKIAGTLKKDFKTALKEVSKNLASHLEFGDKISKIETVNGYINVYVNTHEYTKQLITSITQKDYGKSPPQKDKIMVEYSQPNTHKGFHIGHLRNTCLGAALVDILQYAGYEVVAANLINDTGAHVAKWLWCYLNYHKGETPPEKRGHWLEDIYEEATERLNKEPEYEIKVKEILQKLEQKDPEIIKVWEKTKQWSMEEFERIYTELGVTFDVYFYDSELYQEGKEIVSELQAQGIAQESEGAVIVDVDNLVGTTDVYKTYVVLRSNGTALYQTKDLALAKRKFEDYGIDRSVYVVGSEQKLHFEQVFKTLELAGFEQAQKCYHLSYELVMLKGEKMSSRLGNIIFYDDLYQEVFAEALKEVEKRDIVQENKKETAKMVALGAIKFSLLRKDSNKVIVFDPKEAVSFEGQTGAYVQYAHARASRILEKAYPDVNTAEFTELTIEEKNLLEELALFPDIVKEAGENYKPNVVANYVFDAAQSFNEFYHACPVLKAPEPVKKSRLALVLATTIVLKKGLHLLGIEAPERM